MAVEVPVHVAVPVLRRAGAWSIAVVVGAASVGPAAAVCWLELRHRQRADIRVTKGGTQWLLDVGVVCPATARYVTSKKTHKTPGAAAEDLHKRKATKYAGVPNFVPFAIETGGRLSSGARDFVDNLIDEREPGNRGKTHKVFKELSRRLVLQQLFMLTHIVTEIPQRDLAVEPDDEP